MTMMDERVKTRIIDCYLAATVMEKAAAMRPATPRTRPATRTPPTSSTQNSALGSRRPDVRQTPSDAPSGGSTPEAAGTPSGSQAPSSPQMQQRPRSDNLQPRDVRRIGVEGKYRGELNPKNRDKFSGASLTDLRKRIARALKKGDVSIDARVPRSVVDGIDVPEGRRIFQASATSSVDGGTQPARVLAKGDPNVSQPATRSDAPRETEPAPVLAKGDPNVSQPAARSDAEGVHTPERMPADESAAAAGVPPRRLDRALNWALGGLTTAGGASALWPTLRGRAEDYFIQRDSAAAKQETAESGGNSPVEAASLEGMGDQPLVRQPVDDATRSQLRQMLNTRAGAGIGQTFDPQSETSAATLAQGMAAFLRAEAEDDDEQATAIWKNLQDRQADLLQMAQDPNWAQEVEAEMSETFGSFAPRIRQALAEHTDDRVRAVIFGVSPDGGMPEQTGSGPEPGTPEYQEAEEQQRQQNLQIAADELTIKGSQLSGLRNVEDFNQRLAAAESPLDQAALLIGAAVMSQTEDGPIQAHEMQDLLLSNADALNEAYDSFTQSFDGTPEDAAKQWQAQLAHSLAEQTGANPEMAGQMVAKAMEGIDQQVAERADTLSQALEAEVESSDGNLLTALAKDPWNWLVPAGMVMAMFGGDVGKVAGAILMVAGGANLTYRVDNLLNNQDVHSAIADYAQRGLGQGMSVQEWARDQNLTPEQTRGLTDWRAMAHLKSVRDSTIDQARQTLRFITGGQRPERGGFTDALATGSGAMMNTFRGARGWIRDQTAGIFQQPETAEVQ